MKPKLFRIVVAGHLGQGFAASLDDVNERLNGQTRSSKVKGWSR